MIAAAKALDAVDAAINATFPRPGNWRWEANPKARTVSLGTRGWEAMTFRRWGMNGAQPLFMTRTDVSILRDAADFLQPIPGREHHDWAKRIEHPVAQTIELGVNLLEPLAAVVRAAAEYREAVDAMRRMEGGFSDPAWENAIRAEHRTRDALFAALDAFNAAAAAQGFGPAPSERVTSAPAPSAEASSG